MEKISVISYLIPYLFLYFFRVLTHVQKKPISFSYFLLKTEKSSIYKFLTFYHIFK